MFLYAVPDKVVFKKWAESSHKNQRTSMHHEVTELHFSIHLLSVNASEIRKHVLVRNPTATEQKLFISCPTTDRFSLAESSEHPLKQRSDAEGTLCFLLTVYIFIISIASTNRSQWIRVQAACRWNSAFSCQFQRSRFSRGNAHEFSRSVRFLGIVFFCSCISYESESPSDGIYVFSMFTTLLIQIKAIAVSDTAAENQFFPQVPFVSLVFQHCHRLQCISIFQELDIPRGPTSDYFFATEPTKVCSGFQLVVFRAPFSFQLCPFQVSQQPEFKLTVPEIPSILFVLISCGLIALSGLFMYDSIQRRTERSISIAPKRR
jgi:hypothetical protein